jgi:hypothetical protein
MREFLLRLLQVFHDQALRYAIGGSVASSYYGEPRSTQDIDLSIQIAEPGVEGLVAAFEQLGWYISAEEIIRATQTGGAFSVNDGFWKADIFAVQDESFELETLERRRTITLPLTGQTAWLLSPEDVIVHKLRWCQGKPLDKHLRDITAILNARYPTSPAGPQPSMRGCSGPDCSTPTARTAYPVKGNAVVIAGTDRPSYSTVTAVPGS